MIRSFLAALLTMSCLPAAIVAQGPAPFDIQVELSFEEASGDEGMRKELELQLLSELRRAGCFRSVARLTHRVDEGTAVDTEMLRLTVAVTELFEETTYDTSLAQRSGPGARPGLELAYTSRIRAVMAVTLEHPASGRALRTRHLRGNGTHRPALPGQDARHTALREATMNAARAVRRFVCKGGAKRLRKEIGASPGP
ncbi:MAG: hypothetical protein IH848_06650 [Acidobacteria bacterium]|nr:hypothetical protein [Acidobacteriota bacterium]